MSDHWGARVMRLVGLLLLLWALFGCGVAVMTIYGVFDHVAINGPVMAMVLAIGTALLASLGSILSWRQNRRTTGGRQ